MVSHFQVKHMLSILLSDVDLFLRYTMFNTCGFYIVQVGFLGLVITETLKGGPLFG